MADYHQRRRIAALLVIGAICTGAGLWLAYSSQEDDEGSGPASPGDAQTKVIPPPKLSDSPFRNTKPDAKYVGARACQECHPGAHATYRETAHSEALRPIDLTKEPPDVSFHHEKSGRSYRVYRKNGEFRHQELLPAHGDEEEIILADFPAKYAIGSGHHALSYLMEVDGFLVESPITWYPSRKQWHLSPGYDLPQHWSFSRPVDSSCLQCHTGRLKQDSRRSARVQFHEQNISCENCHGPGSLHVELRRKTTEAVEGIDYTIVNPSHLSRKLQESICAQCHVSGAADIYVRGHYGEDFRPGLPLTDIRIDYQFDLPETWMTVAGHFPQLRDSKCYQQSQTLTCTTCHNPHEKPKEGTELAYYRAKCLSCHTDDGGCKLPEPKRLAKSPNNNCIMCHMKKSKIRIPHLSFTHHRIGLEHTTEYKESKSDGVPLIPILPLQAGLPELDRLRCLGMAYGHYAEKNSLPDDSKYRKLAFETLQKVYAAGIRDPEVTHDLALMYYKREKDQCFDMARTLLKVPDLAPQIRENMRLVLGAGHMNRHEWKQARPYFEANVQSRFSVDDWIWLAKCRFFARDFAGAAAACRKVLLFAPTRIDMRERLADIYDKLNKPQLAAEQRNIASRLRKLPKAGSAKPPPKDD